MPNVVTPDTMVQLITTGKVEPFVAPKDGESAAKPDAPVNAAPDGQSQTATDTGQQPVRGADGKFQSPTGEKTASAQGAADEDDETENLTESVRKKIGKQVRRRKEAEEFARERDADAVTARSEAARLQAELAAARGTKSNGAAPPAATDDGDDPKPKQSDFTTIGDYTDAIVDWRVRKAAREAQAAAAQTTQQAGRDQVVNAFVERREAYEKANPTFTEDVEAMDDDRIPPAASNYIVESEMGPQLMHELAKHPKELERIAKLSPARAVAELGKLEAKIEARAAAPTVVTTQTPANVSKAPAPITPLSDKSVAAVQKDPKDMSIQELRAHRLAERAAKRH